MVTWGERDERDSPCPLYLGFRHGEAQAAGEPALAQAWGETARKLLSRARRRQAKGLGGGHRGPEVGERR